MTITIGAATVWKNIQNVKALVNLQKCNSLPERIGQILQNTSIIVCKICFVFEFIVYCLISNVKYILFKSKQQ